MPTYKPLTNNLQVNKAKPFIMHIDMNSYFASCEQQANPLIRGKVVGVVPYLNDKSTIIAASVQAKKLGIKTGTKVKEAKMIYPNIKLVLADPQKYKYINKKFLKVFKQFTPFVYAKSIDEAYLNFKDVLKTTNLNHKQVMTTTANKIKQKLKNEVGECITCSIGVAPNTFLAKVASNVYKPNGFYYVNYKNLTKFYNLLSLQDLHGVGPKIAGRLNKIGIFTPNQFLNANIYKLRGEFKLFGYHFYLKLRGYEVDDVNFKRKNVGHSFHLTNYSNDLNYLKIVLLKLNEKTAFKLRKLGFSARCFSIYLNFSDKTYFAKSHRVATHTNNTKQMYTHFLNILKQNPYPKKQVTIIGISTSKLVKTKLKNQYDLFGSTKKTTSFYKSVDSINKTYGKFTIYPATLKDYKQIAPDRIAFGR